MITSKADVNNQNLSAEVKRIAERLNVDDIEDMLYFPKHFQVETIRVCNARCPFCPVDQWDMSVPTMSDQLYDKIVEELSEYSHWVEMVDCNRVGEPMLDKKIVERVRKMKQEAGIRRVILSSNASKLTEDKAVALLEAGLDEMMISIDSVDKETYEKLRVRLNYEEVIENIKTFFRVRNEIKPDMIIRVRGVSFFDLNNENDRQELIRWEDFWAPYEKPQDRIYMKSAINWGNQKEWDGHLPQYEPDDWVYHPCIIPYGTFHITSWGGVALCAEDYDAKMNIGDINVQTIAEVWKNEEWARIRKLHRTGKRNDISLCQGCVAFDEDGASEENWREKYQHEQLIQIEQ